MVSGRKESRSMKKILTKCGLLIAGIILAELYEEMQAAYWYGQSPSLQFFYTWRGVRKKIKERDHE